MVAGKDAATFGEGKNSWLTGTAAWTFTCISQYILGIKPELDGLRIDPCIPSDMKLYKCDRRFRGSLYHISVENPHGSQRGIASMTIDGEEVSGNLIPLPDQPAEFNVRVILA
jgi:cellobiose phosphorylase